MTETISAIEAERLLAQGKAVLIDVREPGEFADAHIPYAVSIPLGTLPATLPRLPVGETIIFQCEKGARGQQACALARAAAPAGVRNLTGGIAAWREAGLPLIGARGPGLPLMRQVQIAVGLLVLASVIAGFSGVEAGFYLAGVLGFMLAFAGASGWCGMALLLRRMPWNRVSTGG